MERRTALFIILAVVAAGCIQPTGGGNSDGGGTDTGPAVQGTPGELSMDLSMNETSIYERDSTALTLDIYHMSNDSVTEFEALPVNYDGLVLDGPGPGFGEPVCFLGELPETDGTTPSDTCEWGVETPDGLVPPGQESRTVPISISTSYTRAIQHNRTLEVSFLPDEDISPGDSSVRGVSIGNEELSVDVTASTPVSRAVRTVELSITVQNTGPGMLDPVENDNVVIAFEGELGERNWDRQASSCAGNGEKERRLTVEGQQSIECEIQITAGEDLSSTTFSLKPRVRYDYRVSRPATLDVVGR